MSPTVLTQNTGGLATAPNLLVVPGVQGQQEQTLVCAAHPRSRALRNSLAKDTLSQDWE